MENLTDNVFSFCLFNENYEEMKNRAILSLFKEDIDRLSTEMISKLPGMHKIYYNYNTINNQHEGGLQFTVNFLNSVENLELPPHELEKRKMLLLFCCVI